MTDPKNAQPPRHGIKWTIGGSLARSRPPPLPRRRRCCVLLLLLGLSAAAANNRCADGASAVCRVLSLSFTLCVYTPRALAYVTAQPPRHGFMKRMIGCSLARSWPPTLPRRRRCFVLLRLMRLLRVLLNCRRLCCCCCCLLSRILMVGLPEAAITTK